MKQMPVKSNIVYFVYVIQNIVNNKIYVGKSKNRDKSRFSEHIRLSKSGKGKVNYSLIHSAISKYGEHNFSFQIIEEFENEQECLDAEQFWIEFFRTDVNRYGNDCGYNLTAGGEGISGYHHTLESKRKISKSLTGRKRSKEHTANLVLSRKRSFEEGKWKLIQKFDCCSKIEWPNNESLIEMINLSTYKNVAIRLGVSPEAISARIKRRNLSHLIIEKRGNKNKLETNAVMDYILAKTN